MAENFIKRIEQNKWECLNCNKYHMSRANVKRHIETVHLKFKIYMCSFCEKKFGQKTELVKHVTRIHMSEKLFAIRKLYDKRKEVNDSEIVCPSCKSGVFQKIGNNIFRYNNGISDFENKQSHSTQDSNEKSRVFSISRSPAKYSRSQSSTNGLKREKNEAKKVPKKISSRSKTMAKSKKKEIEYTSEEADTISYDEVLQDDLNYTSDESTEDNDDEADPDWKDTYITKRVTKCSRSQSSTNGSKREKTEAKKVPKKFSSRPKTMAKCVKKDIEYTSEEADTISYDEVLQNDPNYTSDESTEDNDDEADPDWKVENNIIIIKIVKKKKNSQNISKTKHF